MGQTRTVSAEELYDECIRTGDTLRAVCGRHGINFNTARRMVGRYIKESGRDSLHKRHKTRSDTPPQRKREQVRFEDFGDEAEATSVGTRIKTLDQLKAACEVDERIWEVDTWTANKWEVGTKTRTGKIVIEPLFQVKARLKRRQGAEVTGALEALLAQIRAAAPRVRTPRASVVVGNHLLIPSLYDAHVNKRSSDSLYTIEQAARDFMVVADALASKALSLGMTIERVLFPVGNDALHSDNLAGDTTDGTRLEVAGDPRDAVSALIDAYTHAFLYFAEIAPVDAVVVESNHDRFSSYWLGKTLEARFWNDARITVNTENIPRKYYRYGKTMIGLHHGDKQKLERLAVLMATEAPEMWAQTTHRQWMQGHVHYAAGMFYPVTESHGVSVRVIPALCPPDRWHVLRGFVGSNRAADAQFVHREHGPAGTFPVFVDEVVPAPDHTQTKRRTPDQHGGESGGGGGEG